MEYFVIPTNITNFAAVLFGKFYWNELYRSADL